MTDRHESAVSKRATRQKLASIARNVDNVPAGLGLDATKGSVVTVGDRQWTFMMSKSASEEWKTLGSHDIVVGALIYEHTGAAAPFVHRELVLTRRGRKLEMQVREPDKGTLWSGPASINRAGDLEFSVPITRSTSDEKGIMKGQVKRDGSVVFSESKLPRPVKKSQPTEVDE